LNRIGYKTYYNITIWEESPLDNPIENKKGL